MINACLLAGCGVEALPDSDVDSEAVLGAATETPVVPPHASIPSSGENLPPDADENPGENERPVEETVNLAPTILDTSYGCVPNMESVLLSVGETDNFTLSVHDEFPLSMQFDTGSNSPEVVNVSVDENGIFTVMALEKGESDVWLLVSDHEGLMDEYELHIVVE